MGKLKDWWNEPITNGKVIKRQAKGALYSIIGMALLNAWLTKKERDDMEKETVIYTNGEENNEG